ncbi:hypothetical protein ACPYOC_10175 [Ornithinimicrobium sp. W1665]|uniref:hypothetical protein n=1 Tax=Ornithinimicrobium sp. W1665 TaxID=3416666 RepID=UPI003CEE6673
MGMFEAAARRRRAAELRRRLAELDEWDRRFGLGGTPPGHSLARDTTAWRYHSPDGAPPVSVLDPVPTRRPVRRRRRSWPKLLLVLGLGGVALAYAYPDRASTVWTWAEGTGREVLGMPDPDGQGDAPPVPAPGGRDDLPPDVVWRAGRFAGGWEPPRGERLLPAVQPGPGGDHAFLTTQPGTDDPVGFSPCGPVEVAVNPSGAPEGYDALVRASLERLTDASGLQLELVGETDRTWSDDVRGRGEPVLVAWATSDEVPALAGTSAGFGGPTVVTFPDGLSWNASGQVVLDADDLPTPEAHAAVLDHELAHVLGLGHVEAPGELMNAVNTGQTDLGPGDLAGLARLGAIPCP